MSQVSRDNFKLAILTIASLPRYFFYLIFKLFYCFLWVTYYKITQSNPYSRIIAYKITYFYIMIKEVWISEIEFLSNFGYFTFDSSTHMHVEIYYNNFASLFLCCFEGSRYSFISMDTFSIT